MTDLQPVTPDTGSKKSFGRDVGKLVSGTVIAQVVGICLTPVITYIFSPEIYGVASTFISIVSIIAVIACMRYELAILLPKDNTDAGAVFLACLIILVCVSLLSIFVMFFFGDSIAGRLNQPTLAQYLYLIPVAVLIDGLYTILRYWNTRRTRFGTQAATQALQSSSASGLKLGFGILGFVNAGSLIVGQILGQGIGTLILLYQVVKFDAGIFRASCSLKNIRVQIIRYKKFPMIDSWSAVLNTLSGVLPVFLLSIYFSPAAVGLYTLGYQILIIPMGLIGGSIAQVFFQRASIAKHNNTLPSLVENVLAVLTSISIVPFSIFAVTGGVLFSVVFGAEWSEAGVYAQILTAWIFLVFITSPISPIVSILEIQEFGLKMNFITIVLRLISLIIGGVMGSVYLSLVLFMVTGVLLVGYSNYFFVKYSGGHFRVIFSKAKKNIFLSGVFALMFLVMVYFAVSSWIILIAAGIILVSYEIHLFKTDKNVKEMLVSS
ncbi:MAG: oligosaccharide flippase family protein [Methanocorpusculum sp.]|nr:oligosaccharide flippase family protein [Methanocorpusculum sp.]